jgi:hypothetical protein
MAPNIRFKFTRLYSTLWIRRKARVIVRGLDELPRRAKGERRVYILLDHATSLDIAAFLHVSKEPFAILMDRAESRLPPVRRLLRGVSYIPGGCEDSGSCVSACAAAIERGKPLLVSLRDAEAARGDPRSDGIRAARLAGASLYPIFLKAEDERISRRSRKGAGGVELPYTTFKNSFYFIEFLKPVDLSRLPAEPRDEDCLEIARGLDALAGRVAARYEAYLEDNRERFAPLKRRGGSRMRVAW